MSNPYLGEIKLVPYTFAPRGWAFCAGQIVAIQTNTALFSLLGTTYGGNGTSNFGLPDLRGRAPIHRDTQGQYPQGIMEGEEQVFLSLLQMPAHNHFFMGGNILSIVVAPNGITILSNPAPAATAALYGPDTTPTSLNPLSVATIGGSQPHNNMQPFLTMSYIIALSGIFPARN
jgi:microcystin-dependent protein